MLPPRSLVGAQPGSLFSVMVEWCPVGGNSVLVPPWSGLLGNTTLNDLGEFRRVQAFELLANEIIPGQQLTLTTR